MTNNNKNKIGLKYKSKKNRLKLMKFIIFLQEENYKNKKEDKKK